MDKIKVIKKLRRGGYVNVYGTIVTYSMLSLIDGKATKAEKELCKSFYQVCDDIDASLKLRELLKR